jgi:speckle-type POZ protein
MAAAEGDIDPEIKETASRCTTVAEKGAHTFKIDGYSLNKGIGNGKTVHRLPSGTFTVGGVDWVLYFYPDGLGPRSDSAFINLELASKNAEVRARYEVCLLKGPSGRVQLPPPTPDSTMVFISRQGEAGRSSISFKINKDDLESSGYIHDNCLKIRCVITVIKETELSETTRCKAAAIVVPPPDIAAHFSELLKSLSEEDSGADVTFSVDGESIPAHKCILAARSRVFKAELYGPMKTRGSRVTVEDMQPDVFKALLQFVYTDSMPDLGELHGEDYAEMVRHLLVAADRYAMERLKLMCQEILSRNLDVENVAMTLGLADQYNCDKLKDICIEFMSSTDETNDAVFATKGYADLKRNCPSVIVDVYERTTKRRRI